MDDKTQQILDLLKYYNADDLKKLQTKFAKLGNGIQKEAVNSKLANLFDDQELDTLRQAAMLLGSVKSKVEHAKEIKARSEKERDTRLARYEQIKRTLVNDLIPLDESRASRR